MTDIAHNAVEPTGGHRRFRWAADNRVVRAVGRVPLPLGAKLTAGFAVVAALLVVGYVLGLVALGQSNSRGEQLRKLQETAAYDQRLLGEAINLQTLFQARSQLPRRYEIAVGSTIALAASNLGTDFGPQYGNPGNGAKYLPNGLTLVATHPALAGNLLLRIQEIQSAGTGVGSVTAPSPALVSRAKVDADWIETQLVRLWKNDTKQADALVAQDHRSFADSRNLLLGVAGGSLLLALALGLLLSWSVVAPLRRTEDRLTEIGAGDFTGSLDVANRDEIGRLAAKVNNTSDELQRVYRELELASEHKSQFLATMSHELRTPLNAIIGFSEVLREQMFGELNERQLAYVNDVLEAGRHLLSLINDVLDLAKIEAGRMELELSQVPVPALLRNAVSMHSDRAGREGIALACTTEPEEITITADERRVRQIVFNLLSNAVKFTPADGRIDVSARIEDGQVEIAVADTGPGIPADEQETIFEEFEQTTAGKQAEGTGLGLPLSRKLVELHGGRLWVESEPGQGSTFHFTLPVQQEVS